jgi:hypothetical protein
MNESRHTDELEQYLQQQAADHKMYPSDYVWKSIRKKIHTPKKVACAFCIYCLNNFCAGDRYGFKQAAT